MTTQAQVDAFATTYPGCTHLTGSLIIGPSADIVNLNGLAGITSIQGWLEVKQNDVLTDATGLENLTFIGENIFINYNLVLNSLDLFNVASNSMFNIQVLGNSNLQTLHAPNYVSSLTNGSIGLDISNNPNLSVLTGLGALTTITRDLRLSNIKAMSFPNNLANLTFVGTNILISSNENITTLDLFNVASNNMANIQVTNNPNLQTLHAPNYVPSLTNGSIGLEITNNPKLTDLTGLGALTTITRDLRLSNIKATSFPNNLANLTFVGTNILISNNENITTLDLFNVASNNMFNIRVAGNPNLQTLHAPNFVPSLANGSIGLDISNNPNLNTLTGLGSLVSVHPTFRIENTQVASFPNLENLNAIGEFLFSYNSDVLNLDWLSNLSLIESQLTITNNPVLGYCSILAVCNFLSGAGTRTIGNNTGCCLNEPVLSSDCGLAEFEGQTISSSSSYCFEDAGPIIGLSASMVGLTYQLKSNGGADLGAPVVGTGSPIYFGSYPNGNYQVVATAAPGCTASISGSVNGTPGACTISVPSFCACDAPNGRAPVSIKITAPEGQTWTVKAVIGLYDAGSPPNTLIPLAVGTPMQYLGGNMFGLDALRRTDKGFWVQLTNGSTDKDVMVGNAGW
ncbi:MAG: hypothetical protein IPM36_03030 [Lewinellaceae bacterium]|nr:hypothetical protein [Lewinellaceae bacterium]